MILQKMKQNQQSSIINQDTNTTKDVIALKDVKTSPEDAVKKLKELTKAEV